MHKPTSGDSPTEALSLIQTNGIRGKGHPIGLAIQNGALAPGLTAKNGTIYKQQAQVSGKFQRTKIGAHFIFIVPLISCTKRIEEDKTRKKRKEKIRNEIE